MARMWRVIIRLAAQKRAKALVGQILAFSHGSSAEYVEVDLAAICRETLHLLRATLPATVTLTDQLGEVGAVRADPTQLQQVVMNLCSNAAQAMPSGKGTITVRLDEIALDASDLPDGLRPGRHCRLIVADDGSGMPPGSATGHSGAAVNSVPWKSTSPVSMIDRSTWRCSRSRSWATDGVVRLGPVAGPRGILSQHGVRSLPTAIKAGAQASSVYVLNAPTGDIGPPLGRSPHVNSVHGLFDPRCRDEDPRSNASGSHNPLRRTK